MKVIASRSKQIKKHKLFQLKKVGHQWREVREFGNQLISNLGDNIFTIQSKQLLLYNILKQISPINKSLKLDDESIEKACEKIIKNFGLNRKVITSVKVHTDNGWKEVKTKKSNPEKKTNVDLFCEIIIEMDKIPAHVYNILLSQVNIDLKSISELIKWYETQPCIQRHIKDNEIPKSHEDRIIYDFYIRCVNERVIIFNYQL